MRYRLRTLLIAVAIGPPLIGLVVPPLARWLIAAKPAYLEGDDLRHYGGGATQTEIPDSAQLPIPATPAVGNWGSTLLRLHAGGEVIILTPIGDEPPATAP